MSGVVLLIYKLSLALYSTSTIICDWPNIEVLKMCVGLKTYVLSSFFHGRLISATCKGTFNCIYLFIYLGAGINVKALKM